jgi:hypothetical protein
MVAVVAGVLFIGHAIRSFGDILAEVALQVGGTAGLLKHCRPYCIARRSVCNLQTGSSELPVCRYGVSMPAPCRCVRALPIHLLGNWHNPLLLALPTPVVPMLHGCDCLCCC